jgi:hypothetical protein
MPTVFSRLYHYGLAKIPIHKRQEVGELVRETFFNQPGRKRYFKVDQREGSDHFQVIYYRDFQEQIDQIIFDFCKKYNFDIVRNNPANKCSTNPNSVSPNQRIRKPKGDPKTKCSKCQLELEPTRVGKQRYCCACHAEYMRINRPKHSELTDEQRKKAIARSYAKEYQKKGVLKKKPCDMCGNEDSEKHHPDYNKPLEVRWLCRVCHLDHHRFLAEGDDQTKPKRKRKPIPVYSTKNHKKQQP